MTVTPNPSEPWDEKSVVKSVLKALSVLECFSPSDPELTVAELAERTGVQKATCSRLVTTMMHAGWVERVGRGRYAPTVKLFRLGATAVGRIDLRQAARPLLRTLVAQFGDTGYLTVPDVTNAVCLDRAEGTSPLQLHAVEPGSSLPFHASAGPLAILAHRDDLFNAVVERHGLERFTDETATTVDELRERLARVRARGYAVSSEDYLPGVAAIGAPVFDSDGKAVAAISLGGMASRFESPRLEEIAASVAHAAAELSTALGYIANGAVPDGGPT